MLEAAGKMERYFRLVPAHVVKLLAAVVVVVAVLLL